MTVLVKHDHGCGWARIGTVAELDAEGQVTGATLGAGHTDAAKRFSDTYNLHRAAGVVGGWIAIRYFDGSGGEDVFDTREEAVSHMWPKDNWYFYCTLSASPSLTVCAAESMLRWKRLMHEADSAGNETGMEVIPFLTAEDRAEQVAAARSGRGLLAMGQRLHGNRKG